MEQTDFAGAIKEKYASAASKSYQVYYDSALTQRVDITIKRDYDAKSVTMIVTVFTTKEEMNTPTLTQGVAEDGNYRLSWSAVEGADYYEVYEYHPGMDFAALEVATSDTSCTYSEFQTAIDYETSFKETFAGTEVDVDEQYLMNCMLDMENGYFVVARKNDGTHSGMSNTCMLSEIAGQIIEDSMSDFEKEEAINRYLCENASYNDQIMDYINADGTIDAEAFLLLAKEAGLDAIITTGTLDGVNHEWNRICLDGSWYTIDVTNNDNDYLPNIYFNLPDDLASKRLIQNDNCFINEYIENYTSSGMDCEYYTQNNLYTEDAGTAADLLAEAASQNQVAAIRLPADTDASDVQAIAQAAASKAQIASGRYYFDYGVLSLITE